MASMTGAAGCAVSGAGPSLIAFSHPGVDHLAVEVWQTAIASLVRSITEPH